MPLDFPTSPTNGQAYNGYVYSTSVGAWQAKPAAQSPFYTSDTPPSNPVAGDSWFNTNDGTMYIYYNDGNTSQWAEHRSEIARSQVGLVPVSPASVTVGSGTATTDVNGLVTFSGVTSLSLNGVFTNTFAHYKMILEISSNTADSIDLRFRLRTSGTDNTNASYAQLWTMSRANGTIQSNNGWGIATSTVTRWWSTSDAFIDVVGDILSPKAARTTKFQYKAMGWDSTSQFQNDGTTVFANGTQFDGFTFYPTSGNFTGTMKVYGYN